MSAHDTPAIHEYSPPSNTPVALQESHGAGSAHVHVTPPYLLLGVYGALVVLTVLTVAVTKIPLGDFNIWVALGIAVIKASLVAVFFMHLRWDSPFNGIILIVSFFFVAIFIGIAVMDSKEYQKNYAQPGIAVRPQQQ